MKKISIFILTAVILVACASTPTKSTSKTSYQANPSKLIGLWVFSKYEASSPSTVLQQKDSFLDDAPGIQFLAEGKLLKRQNSGSCGTPPIHYSNEKGTWSMTSDSTLTIQYSYWGGLAEEDWLITAISTNELKYKRLDYRNKGRMAPINKPIKKID